MRVASLLAAMAGLALIGILVGYFGADAVLRSLTAVGWQSDAGYTPTSVSPTRKFAVPLGASVTSALGDTALRFAGAPT